MISPIVALDLATAVRGKHQIEFANQPTKGLAPEVKEMIHVTPVDQLLGQMYAAVVLVKTTGSVHRKLRAED